MGIGLALKKQFGRPSGAIGHLVGWTMANTGPNRQRSRLTVQLLDLRPGARVLELGFGPGLAIQEIAMQVGPTGFVAGVDPSDIMASHAERRNAAAVRKQRVDLRVGDASDLPDFGGKFDAVFAVNSYHHWQDPDGGLREVYRVLKPGGLLAITEQPRGRETGDAVIEQTRVRLEDALVGHGFTDVNTTPLVLKPVPGLCVRGYK